MKNIRQLCRMGQKRKKPIQDIQYELSRMMVPRDLLEYFEVHGIKELNQEWHVELHEKVDLIPEALKGNNDVALDGFCNPLTVLSHCFSLKPIYLVIKRRRWKRSGSNTHYSNEYTICEDGSKLTADMAGFLKK
jgi:hypothetical protein